MRITLNALLAVAILTVSAVTAIAEDTKVFSGPQVGENLPALKVKGVFGDEAGKDFDYVKLADGKPTVLIFMHKLTRPAAMVSRLIMTHCGKQDPKKFFAGVVFLSDDATAAEQRLKRAKRALVPNENMKFGVSGDGAEGPGSYGLNRKMTLTVLVANKGKVTANFALVQPGPDVDVMKVVKEVVKLTGGKTPTLASLGGRYYAPGKKKRGKKRPAQKQDPNLRGYLSPIIQKDATEKEVDAAEKKLEDYLKKNPATRVLVGDIARRIIKSGLLERYGTKRAREHMKRWAKEFTAPKKTRKRKTS